MMNEELDLELDGMESIELTDEELAEVAGGKKSCYVKVKEANIRSGPGTDNRVVQTCPPGVYTIVAVSGGAGSSAGWGKLKSGVGWLSLDYVKQL